MHMIRTFLFITTLPVVSSFIAVTSVLKNDNIFQKQKPLLTWSTKEKIYQYDSSDEYTNFEALVVAQNSREIEKKNNLTLPQLALAGAIAALVGDAALHPVDCIKTIQQSDYGQGVSFFDAGMSIWKIHGINGFYYGLAPYALSDVSGSAVKFTV